MKWDAQQYDAVKAPQVEAGRELISMANVRKTDSILDLGCGTGKLTVELSHLASEGKITGIDSSSEMIEKAKDRTKLNKNIFLLQIAAESMNFNNKFDLVFSNSALHWIKKQQKVLTLIYQSLKKEGRIAFQCPAENFCREFFEYISKAIDLLELREVYRNWESPWFLPKKEDYETLLKDTGFKNINVFYKDYNLVFKNINEVLDWWTSAGLKPYLVLLAEKEQEYFKYAFIMNFEKNRTKKGIEFKFRRLFAFAEK
jgi:trans-aconitate methyltransferase